jgi:DNA repair ATPase RecN
LEGTHAAGRINEIARMLGGPAETAKKHARTLLGVK